MLFSKEILERFFQIAGLEIIHTFGNYDLQPFDENSSDRLILIAKKLSKEMSLYAYLLLFGTIVLSGLSFFAFKTVGAKQLKLLLSFSGSYLFALTVLHYLTYITTVITPSEYSSSSVSFYKFVLNFFQKVLNTDTFMFTNTRMQLSL